LDGDPIDPAASDLSGVSHPTPAAVPVDRNRRPRDKDLRRSLLITKEVPPMCDFGRFLLLVCIAVAFGLAGSCAQNETTEEQLTAISVDSMEGVLTKSGVTLDGSVSSDGNGSLRVDADSSMTVRLYEIADPDVEDALLTYRAKMKTEGITGRAYLEMWCRLPGQGEFFSRGLQAPVSGTTDWTSQEIHFRLEKGQNPDLVKLNVVIDGEGRLWIDDIVLAKGPLR
jgi:hypothetical protein